MFVAAEAVVATGVVEGEAVEHLSVDAAPAPAIPGARVAVEETSPDSA